MAPLRRNREDIVARLNFPLYTVQMLTNRHVIVGGGGGSAKTGVANGFEIFELSHDGTKFLAEEVTRHETGPIVVMNCAAFSHKTGLIAKGGDESKRHSYLVAGQESECQLYIVKSVLVTSEENVENIAENNEIRERKPKTKQKTDNNRNVKKLKFVIKPLNSVQTDFKGSEPLVRVSRINQIGTILATGGTDGIVRLWSFPSMSPTFNLKAHTKEIDDIDFSPYGNYLITIAKDGLAILWDWSKGTKIRMLTWQQPEGSKYLYKRSRFGRIEGEDQKSALYMLVNPTGMAKKQKSYLQQWLPEEGVLKKVSEFDESLSALAVRNDGRFVAVGTMFSGSVSIHVAFSLQKVLNVKGAHSMFVTGLEFLPISIENHVVENHAVTSVAEAAVLSISVDNHVCIHALPYRKTMPAFLGILILVLTLFFTFVFCSYIGL